jgi:tetratricopeptide (TPR) repeat protein
VSGYAAARAAGLPPVLSALPDPFVGRRQTLLSLSAGVKSHPVTLVTGAPGIGKSALLARFRETLVKARRNVLFFRCTATARDEDFWAGLLGAMGKAITGETRGSLLAHLAIAALTRSNSILIVDDLQRLPRALAVSFLNIAAGGLERGRLVAASQEPLPPIPGEKNLCRIALEGLAPEEVTRLLTAVSRRRLTRQELASLAGFAGHPLAVRLAAAHPDVALGSLGLGSASGGLLETKVLPAIFKRLTAAERELLEWCSLAGGHCPKALWKGLGIANTTVAALLAGQLADRHPDGLTACSLVAEATGTVSRERRRVLAKACNDVFQKSPSHLRFGLLAVDNYLGSGEHDDAVRLLVRLSAPLLAKGLAQEYLTRLALLPSPLLEQHPGLGLDRAHWHRILYGGGALVRSLLESFIHHPDAPVRARALAEVAELELAEGNGAQAAQLLAQVIPIQRASKLDGPLAAALVRMGELRVVSDSKSSQSSFDEATTLAKRANAPALQLAATVGLARNLDKLEQFDAAAALHKKALRQAKALKSPPALARTLVALGAHHHQRIQYKQARHCLALARKLYSDFGDIDSAARVAGQEAEILVETGHYNLAAPLLAGALQRLGGAQPSPEAAALWLMSGLMELEQGTLEQASDTLCKALDSYHALHAVREVVRVETAQAVLMRQRGNRAGAWVLLQGLLVDIRRHQWAPEEAEVLYRLASQALEEGRLEEAKTLAAQAAVRFEQLHLKKGHARARALLLRIAFAAGPLSAADRLAQDEVKTARRHDDPRGLAMALTLLAEIRLEQDRASDAVRLLKEALRLRQACGDARGVVTSRRLLALAALRDRLVSECRTALHHGLHLARAGGMATELAHLHLVAGVLAHKIGRQEDALSHLNAARDHAEGMRDLELLLVALAVAIHQKSDAQSILKQLYVEWLELAHDVDPARLERLGAQAALLGIPLPRQ